MWWLIGGALGVLFMTKQSIAETIEENLPSWNRFDALFKKYAAKYSVDAFMLKAICLNESDLGQEKSVARGLENPKDIEGSKSSDGKSWGLMQVTLTTAREPYMDTSATAEKLNNAEYSIDLAAKYIAWLKRYFPDGSADQTQWLVKSYNQGPGNSLNERAGKSQGFAHEYWNRFQRNYTRAKEKGLK